MVSEENLMFKMGGEENKSETIIRHASAAMEEKC